MANGIFKLVRLPQCGCSIAGSRGRLTPLLLAATMVVAFCSRPACGADESKTAQDASTPNAVAGKIPLRLQLKPGQKFEQRVTANSTQTIVYTAKTRLPGNKLTTSHVNGSAISEPAFKLSPARDTIVRKLTMVLHNEVLPAKHSGDIEIRLTYGRATLESLFTNAAGKANLDVLAYDAAAARLLGALNGQSVKITLSPRSRVQKVEGGEHVMRVIAKSISPRTGLESQELETWWQEILVNSADMAFNLVSGVVLPEHPVGIGDEWQSVVSSSTPIDSARAVTTYAVTGIANGQINAIASMKIVRDGEADAWEPVLSDFKQTTALTIDAATGLNLSGETTSYMAVKEATQTVNGVPTPSSYSRTYSKLSSSYQTTLLPP